jgi:DNA-binding response OmpR family regulator
MGSAAAAVTSSITMTVLLLDDHMPSLNTRTWLLHSKGYTVVGCQTAEEVINAIQARNFDLVILDWFLSGATSAGLPSAIRAVQPDTYILVFSAAMPGELELPIAGVDDFVSKTEGPKILLSKVAAIGQVITAKGLHVDREAKG